MESFCLPNEHSCLNLNRNENYVWSDFRKLDNSSNNFDSNWNFVSIYYERKISFANVWIVFSNNFIFSESHRRIDLLLWFCKSLRLFVFRFEQYCLFCYLFSLSNWYRIILLIVFFFFPFFFFFCQQLYARNPSHYNTTVFTLYRFQHSLFTMNVFLNWMDADTEIRTPCSRMESKSNKLSMGNDFMLSIFIVSS